LGVQLATSKEFTQMTARHNYNSLTANGIKGTGQQKTTEQVW